MSGPIGVGLVGCGRVGLDWHMPDIVKAGGNVVALADAAPGRASRYAADYGVPRTFDDWRLLIEDPTVEVVDICTPPSSHAEIAIAAFRAGRHVFLEKPPTMNRAEMEAVLDAARASGRCLQSGSNQVFRHESRALRDLIAAGRLGSVYLVEAFKSMARNAPKGWHRLKAVGGGGVGMNSVPHRLDLALFLLGDPRVLSVSARTWDRFADMRGNLEGYLLQDVAEGVADPFPPCDVEDTLAAFVHFEGGASLLLRDAAIALQPEEWSFRFFGTKASAALQPLRLFEPDAEGKIVVSEPGRESDPPGSHELAFRHFFDAVRKDAGEIGTGVRSVALMGIIDAIYRSAAEGGRDVRL